MNPRSVQVILGTALMTFVAVAAQAPKEVPVTEEPRHHFSFENEFVRAFRVEVAPHDRTLLHRHDRDYFYISLGAADLTNAVYGRPEVHAQMVNFQIGFAKGGFAHVAVNLGDTPFRNFTVEFKRPQTKFSNRCAKVDATQPLNCPNIAEDSTSITPEFETEDAAVTLLRVKPGAKLTLDDSHSSRLLMPIDEINAQLMKEGGATISFQTGKEVWSDSGRLTVVNNGRTPARILSMFVKDNAKRP
ncbi:MAG: hypothetical protein HY046_13195 [Acidobacteria bacterium]|nr:hypothetical protein [Acidobacteriota bacterium]